MQPGFGGEMGSVFGQSYCGGTLGMKAVLVGFCGRCQESLPLAVVLKRWLCAAKWSVLLRGQAVLRGVFGVHMG